MLSNQTRHGGDRRSRRTAIALRQSLIELLLEKPLRDITIAELTERADVSRTTFYLHYHNLYDLFDEMERDIYEQFEAMINLSLDGEGNDMVHAYVNERGTEILPIMEQVFQFIYDNPDLSVVLLHNPDSTFLDKVLSRCHVVTLERVRRMHRDEIIRRHARHYSVLITHALRGLIEYWIATDFHTPMDEMVEIASTFLLNNHAVIRHENERYKRLQGEENHDNNPHQ
ncbi:MAG: TetR/AcrR family transcriptional regulator [Saccharofermentanales bacterium]|jgi:AcrR family transcriptional regulator